MSTVQQPVDNWVTGSDSYQTTLATIASGQNLPDKTPLGQITASGKLVKWAPAASDGSQVATHISQYLIRPLQLYICQLTTLLFPLAF
ncbi:MAG: head decoration protein [Gammaproteobacteria bacterium]|nr:head decoration protein [Gammaproteobacteria bacterium]